MPHFPEALNHVWGWFCELDKARQSGMQINPISYSEIEAWANLKRIKPMPFEVKCIKVLDCERMNHAE